MHKPLLLQLGAVILCLVLAACQAPFISNLATAHLTLEIKGLGLVKPGTQSRALSPDATSVWLKLERSSLDSVPLFDAEALIETDAISSKKLVRIRANIPLGVDLLMIAEVRDSNGTVLFSGTSTVNFSSTNSSTPVALSLLPEPTNPNLLVFDANNPRISIPAQSWRILSFTLDEALADSNVRIVWEELTSTVQAQAFYTNGTNTQARLVREGRGGAWFPATSAGTHYLLIKNDNATELLLDNIRFLKNDTSPSISFTLDNPLDGVLAFNTTALVCTKGDTVLIGNVDYASLSNWEWAVDGVVDTTQTSSSFTWDTASASNATIGDHILSVAVLYQGVRQSGTLKVSINPSSLGTVPTLLYYNTGATSGQTPPGVSSSSAITVSGAGSLERTDAIFYAWRQRGGSDAGRIYPSASTITLSADTILEPVWMPLVPAGSYQRDATLGNNNKVNAFYMSPYEVSQAEYLAVMGTNPSNYTAADRLLHPVENMTWFKAIEYCNVLSELQGLSPVYTLNGSASPPDWTSGLIVMNREANGYRLPTEAEWTWAAMGTNKTPSHLDANGVNTYGYSKSFAGSTGSNSVNTYAWSNANSDDHTQIVGIKSANELGIYDLSGNVFEACWESNGTGGLETLPTGLLSNYAGPGGNSTLSWYISRGCSYKEATASFPLTLTYRILQQKGTASLKHGFRLVRSATESAYVPTLGLAGEWLFDTATSGETSGNNLSQSINFNTSITDLNGNANRAMEFTAPEAFTSAAPFLRFGSEESFSLSTWFKTTYIPPTWYYGMGHAGTAGTFQYFIEFNTNNRVNLGVGKNNTGVVGASAQIQLNTWYHAVLVYNGANHVVSGWLNGEAIGTATYPYGPVNAYTSGPFHIGNANSGTAAYDQVRIYNRALSADEVMALYREMQ